MDLKFKKGDFLQNKDPYENESELLIVEIDMIDKEYRCAKMKGKHNKEADFDNRHLLPFDDAHRSYKKVG